MTTMKPCPKCHSTEHLHIEIIDDNSTVIFLKKCEPKGVDHD